MKKIATWLLVITFIIFLVDWAIMGIKLLDNNYNIIIEAYIGLACWVVILASIICRSLSNKCPHCGKIRITKGMYCSYCGSKISER